MKISREDFHQRMLPILSAQAIGLLCGIAGVRLTSYLVAPADYGLYGVFVSLAPVGASVVYIGLVKFVSRHWGEAGDRPGLLRGLLAATVRRLPWLLAVVVLLSVLTVPSGRVVFATLLFVSAYLLSLTQIAQSALQAMRAHWRDCGVSAGVSLTRSFAPPLLYALTGAGVIALLSGFTLQAMVGAGLAVLSLRPWWRRTADGSGATRPAGVYEGPLFAMLAVAGWLVAGSNRWLVAWFFGAETTGYFTLAGNIGVILPAMLGLVVQQYCQPDWFAPGQPGPAGSRELLRKMDRAAGGYTVLALGLAALVHLVVPRLVGPLVSSRYASATQFVVMTGFFGATLTIGNFYHVMLLAAKRERACPQVDLSGAGCLLLGGVLAAGLGGLAAFKAWLLFSPVVPWAVNRTLARRAILQPA